jgi:hypothetical protein
MTLAGRGEWRMENGEWRREKGEKHQPLAVK